MLVLLPLMMWGQEGYWTQYDKQIYKANDGQYWDGVTMDGTYGRFTMKSVRKEDWEFGDHNCKGEWLYGVITYTEPKKYYQLGDTLETTYQTHTTHSSPFDGVPFPGGPNIHCYIYTGYDKERNICVNIGRRAKNENGQSWIGPELSENNYKDISTTVKTDMPQGSNNSIITIVFGFGHGNGEDGVDIVYYYKWTEGKMPLE